MPDTAPPVILPQGYYLENFNTLVDFVAKHYWPLLNAQEQRFFQRYQQLSIDGQCLYIRLLSRSKAIFRQRRLQYDEITSIDATVEELEQAALIAVAPALSIDDALALFTRDDLHAALQARGQPKRRAAMLEQITNDIDALKRLWQSDNLLAVLEQQTFEVFRLLFFGNLYQDLTAFVLRDLGLQKYEPYAIDTETLPFTTRCQIDQHLHYHHCRQLFEVASGSGVAALLALHAALPKPAVGDTMLRRRVDKLAATIARQLEREQAGDQAIAIYTGLTSAPARERLARLLAKRGDNSAALGLCRQILTAPDNSDELHFARQFGARLASKTGTRWPATAAHKPDTVELLLHHGNGSVEMIAADHYSQFGQCFYVENSLIPGILGLAVWDIIYAPIRGAFYHPFHTAPVDFNDAHSFRTARQALLAQRWQQLEQGALSTLVHRVWQDKFGISNPLVHWQYLTTELIDVALERIPLAHWLALFDYLLQDLRNHRNGLPDLIFFPQRGGYQLIEIKGPGDRLQNNQRRWMERFQQVGIDHCVANVSWQTEDEPAASGLLEQ